MTYKKSNILQQIAIGGIESYEPEVAQLVKNYSHFTCPKYFFDVGANIGFYSVLAEAYFPQEAHVFAVEPFPANAHYLRQLKEHNQLNFTIIEKALDEYPDLQKSFIFQLPLIAHNYRLAPPLLIRFVALTEFSKICLIKPLTS